MKLRLAAIVIVSVSVLVVAAWGQDNGNSIDLGGVRLTPGMDQESVLAKLGENYSTQKMDEKGGTSRWYVFRKGEPVRGKMPHVIGSVDFRNGRDRKSTRLNSSHMSI